MAGQCLRDGLGIGGARRLQHLRAAREQRVDEVWEVNPPFLRLWGASACTGAPLTVVRHVSKPAAIVTLLDIPIHRNPSSGAL